jgi:L,D-transpeptidase catalytic domain
MRLRTTYLLISLSAVSVGAIAFRTELATPFSRAMSTTTREKTVNDRLSEFGAIVRARLQPCFGEIGVTYPPKKLVLVGLKQEKQLELWVSEGSTDFRLLKTYPILAASGVTGPKLREGDRQVPEGLYRIESLNPNSRYHLALRVNYPNTFDKEHGRRDGRTNLGSDIMIHGGAASIGCLAMGDQVAEDLFVLAAETRLENISVILAPLDFRIRETPQNLPPVPGWTADLYANIQKALAPLKR